MDPDERMSRQRDARRRIGAQRRRVGILRSRAIAISLICFALLWTVVFVQMATGNDPVLGGGRHAAGATAARPDRRTDSEQAGGAGAAAAETVETTSPEENELEALEPEPVEAEVVEVEPEPEPEVIEPEPVPIETAQS
jgi:hypothetical protein